MTYDELKKQEGNFLDIVLGELVLSDNGFIKISSEFKDYNLVLDDENKSFNLVIPYKEYRGHTYKLRNNDCVSLYSRWFDDQFGTNFLSIYKNASYTKFLKYYKSDFKDWFKQNNFLEVTDLKYGDCLFYNIDNKEFSNHIGAYLGENKILHHLPNKYSSIDNLETSKIQRIFRYAK